MITNVAGAQLGARTVLGGGTKFIRYALPLIQGETGMVKENGLPRFAKLKKVRA